MADSKQKTWIILASDGRHVTVGRATDRRKRLIALGNAVVPAIPELIGRAILAHLAP